MAIRNYPEYKSIHDNYLYVEDVDKTIDKILEDCNASKNKVIAVDTETYYDASNTGVIKFIQGNPNNVPFCVTLYCNDTAYYISKDLDKLKRLFSNDAPLFVYHNHKYDRHMLANIGIEMPIDQIGDTMLMIHLINEEFMCNTPDGTKVKSKKLKDLAYHFLGKDAHDLENLVGEYRAIKGLHNKAEGIEGGKNGVSYKEVEELNRDLMKDYACADVDFTYHLYMKFVPEITRQDLWDAYALDKEASDAVYKMERRGVKIDKEYYTKLYEDYGKDLEKLDKELSDATGIEDFSSDKDADIVKAYSKLGVVWAWKTEKGQDRTDKKVLDGIARQFNSNEAIVSLTEKILLRRDTAKIRDTFVKNMLEFCQADGRVHPDFNICPNDYSSGATRTGRLSSSNPNFQNLPKDDKRIRKGIIPEKGYCFVEIDAAQQEYRMLGHYSQDANFMKLIHDGIDVHTGTAMLMLGLDHDTAAIKKNRQVGKRLNFALVYGLGLSALCVSLGYPLDEARYNKATARFMRDKLTYNQQQDLEFLKSKYPDDSNVAYYCSNEAQDMIKKAKEMKDKYFAQFPTIQTFLNKVKQACRDRGYVRTWGRRKRHFENPAKDAYKAPNALIQGSCGDILKKKLWELEEFLANKKTRIVNTVHDSILFEVWIPEAQQGIVDDLLTILKDLPFRVPMDWEADGSEISWADIKPYETLDFNKMI